MANYSNTDISIPVMNNYGINVTNISDVINHSTSVGHVTKVLLVTYFRGGSTFLGEAFNTNQVTYLKF